ncbi:PaaX family transcriptional regulator C-terminal domain-containing protein [Alloyangia pacifica]|uniref:Transcriptional regulator, PaaX family n=1 Tax=Alloyangia pacifica TaxID=311180 RepID=A0A1I6VIY5_9RHOB|nr:PaaX family transcriptional regulator C-terminal domain-containing protein [Alloyangia pacifica]SDI00237.1 transcriptional regulator, PaaX family [Alloyangia pacifica]SFT13619.1 transcriptional regulator, PaaX family [Alloyangia pacifica]
MNEVAGQFSADWEPALTEAPRAPAFIVTLYGDVVEPRGGMLWMGTLIECCAVHGLNESLVRTAVSRLVGAGRLEGVRIGRRSYYRLSDAARDEFRDAARLLFSPVPAPDDWLLCLSDGLREADLPGAWARLSPNVAIAPNREDVAPLDGILMRAKHLDGHGDLRSLSRERWALDDVATAYESFVKRHSGLLERIDGGAHLSAAESLALRLRLVHDYRHAALIDPRLPRAAWPQDWPAERARKLFVAAYVGLSDRADAYVGAEFVNNDGMLMARNEETDRRLFQLKREAAA